MALSKRERILAMFETVLQPMENDGTIKLVQRTLVDPNTREDDPFVSIDWTGERADPQTVPFAERTLSVMVSYYVRGDGSDTMANALSSTAHALIMADPTLGGLAVDVQIGDTTFDAQSADQSAGKLTQEYLVKYRHSYGDMTA